MFKKIKLYRLYRKTLKSNIGALRDRFVRGNTNESYVIKDIGIDWLCRIYTVLNFVPQSRENIAKYGYRFMDNEAKKFVQEINSELREMGLFELYGLSKADQKADKVYIVVEFSPFNSVKFARKVVFWGLALIAAIITTLIIVL